MKKYIITENEVSPLGETIYSFTLSCGLTVKMIRKKGFKQKYASFTVDYGSDDICFNVKGDIAKTVLPFGTAHFLEHKLFEQKKKNAMEAFSALGASSNAGTGHVMTRYYFTCTDNFEKSLKLLMKFVTGPYLTDENVEKEKGIIAQEIKMYEDDPEEVCSVNMMKVLYKSNYARYDIAGTCEDISHINRSVLAKAYETFYTPENAVLTVVGDLDPEYVADMLDSMNIRFKGSGLPERLFPNEQRDPEREYVECGMSAAKKLFCIGFKDDEKRFIGENGIKNAVAADIAIDMLAGTSSDFYNRLYDSGLVNRSFGAYGTEYRTHAVMTFEGESDEPEKVLEEIKKEIRARTENGFSDDEFLRAKNTLIGNNVKSCNSPAGLGSLLSTLYLHGCSLIDYFDCCAKITKEDAEQNFRAAFSGRPVLSVVHPLKENGD